MLAAVFTDADRYKFKPSNNWYMENKSAQINALALRLGEDLGSGCFNITDHWEADRRAIGISKQENPGVLLYIHTDEEAKLFFAALELPSETDDYENAGEYADLTYHELLVIIKKHLGL